jgi:hypothetical protein
MPAKQAGLARLPIDRPAFFWPFWEISVFGAFYA